MDDRRRKTVHAARRPEERPKDASHSSTFTECTAAMLTLPSFAGPTSARSVTRTVRMRFSVGTPLTFADDGQSGAVNDEVQAGARAGAPKREGEMLTASRERGVIGCREIDAQHPEDRCQEALGLTQR